MERFYRRINGQMEFCFYIETTEPLTKQEQMTLRYILAEGFILKTITTETTLDQGSKPIETGPQMNFATFWSTNMVSICHACGLKKVTRTEYSERRLVPKKHDRMTQCIYPEPLQNFQSGIIPEPVYLIPMMKKGPNALLDVRGLAMDEWDRNFYHRYFTVDEGRNPTIVEIKDLDNANSEHSRHGYFKGQQIIDGQTMPETLLEIVQSTLEVNPSNSIIAFKDNSSGIRGYNCWTIIPEKPGQPSPFVKGKFTYHIIFTAETHNFPTGVAPFPGAETGTGGRIRDIQATGKGALVIAGTTGYCVAHLLIPGYDLPWEDKDLPYPSNLASSLDVEIRASDGASDYGNKFGEPVIQGFTRSFDQRLPDGQRWAWIKKLMFTGGIGQIDDRHTQKDKPEKGLLIVQVGGPAYRIGVSGGAASSMLQGENAEDLDFNAVQRGDAEMEQKMNRVIRACVEMGDNNPIRSAHDQGAGGPGNILKELVETAGGKIYLRRIKLGDSTLSTLEIWIAEFQERCGFLIHRDRIEEFKSICQREKVNCEELGQVTGDGRFVVYDEKDSSTPVDLDLNKVLGNIPQKTFKDQRIEPILKPLILPEDLSVEQALYRVLRNVAVGSKRFLTNKVDRSVTGLIVQQPCCGPLQLTVSDVAVIAQSHFGLTGAAISIGEQPIKMILNPKAGARMAIAEALTNLVWAKISSLNDVKCSANWMWAPKLPGEGTALYDAATAMRDLMIQLSIAVDGGKDSLSMATRIGDEIVKSPRELVVSAYATMPDIRKVITPDIKTPDQSRLLYIDLANGKKRLGGSILAQCFKQIGNNSPDMENANLLKRTFNAIQKLIDNDLILAGHDISDGGLIVAVLEMAFAGNCGLKCHLDCSENDVLDQLFAEEAGVIIEYRIDDHETILSQFDELGIPYQLLGITTSEKEITFMRNVQLSEKEGKLEVIFQKDMQILRQWWEETSYQIERCQSDSTWTDQEKKNIFQRKGPQYFVSFKPQPTPEIIIKGKNKPKAIILREEGSNGDREMTSAFYQAGFETWDVTMTDLIEGRIVLDPFKLLVDVGGFSYADVPESAKGWAATIRFNKRLSEMFQKFYLNPDTLSLNVCNGCQKAALLGWVPWAGISDEKQPRFIKNSSGRFRSSWTTVKILPSPAIMLQSMEESTLGIWVAHGEGKVHFPDTSILDKVLSENLVPMIYVDDNGLATEEPPFNPNGSPSGIAALCTPDGRHLAMMPHPERAFLKWQWAWMTKSMDNDLEASPWLQMFQNARRWCKNH